MASGVAILGTFSHRAVGCRQFPHGGEQPRQLVLLPVEFDGVASRIGQKCLATPTYGRRVSDSDAPIPELGHRSIELGHADGEVLTEARWGRSLKKVNLTDAEVDPGASEPEIGSVCAQDTSKHLGVEGSGEVDVGDVDRYMVHGQRLHKESLPGPRSRRRLRSGSSISVCPEPAIWHHEGWPASSPWLASFTSSVPGSSTASCLG